MANGSAPFGGFCHVVYMANGPMFFKIFENRHFGLPPKKKITEINDIMISEILQKSMIS